MGHVQPGRTAHTDCTRRRPRASRSADNWPHRSNRLKRLTRIVRLQQRTCCTHVLAENLDMSKPNQDNDGWAWAIIIVVAACLWFGVLRNPFSPSQPTSPEQRLLDDFARDAQLDLLLADPPIAENGSRYGELSELTGRPKTVHVRGYYRRDGTHVRGHYRSPPRAW